MNRISKDAGKKKKSEQLFLNGSAISARNSVKKRKICYGNRFPLDRVCIDHPVNGVV